MIANLVHEAMTARAEAVRSGLPVDVAWQEGVALGVGCADSIGRRWQQNAVQIIADVKETAPRADSVREALAYCFTDDERVRQDIAHKAGVLVGWRQGLEDAGVDVVDCAACGAAISMDVEPARVCAGDIHEGVWCDGTCMRDGGCGRVAECFDQGRDR